MNDRLEKQKQAYAELIVKAGVNLQPGQAVVLRAEPAQREMAWSIMAAAYDAGARHVDMQWLDPIGAKVRFQHIDHRYLDYMPEFEVTRRKEMLAGDWVTIFLTGSEFPDALEEIDPALIRQTAAARAAKLEFYATAVMNNEISWCVASAPTVAWAQKVFPDLEAGEALERLWEFVLKACRADQPDPIQTWADHDARLKEVAAFMDRNRVRRVRFLDEAVGPDGRPRTDLTVGLTDRPAWSCGTAVNKAGLPFFANIPTEEIFTTPHKDRVQGWTRTSKPGFPFDREVLDAYFRFEDGLLVEWRAEKGQEVLDELFKIDGARHLGEVALVDVRSPINQSGLIFHDTLFDENAVSHIAFGRAYPEGVVGGSELDREALTALGVNRSDTHEDLMIGSPTMRVIATTADGREVPVMERGQFVEAVYG